MNNEKMDSSAVSIMFEEIKQKLEKVENKLSKNKTSEINVPDLSDLKNCINQFNEQLLPKLRNAENAITKPRVQKVNHCVSVDIKSSWVVVTILCLSLLFCTSLSLIYNLKEANDRLSDNDLKYRYIRMQGEANHDTLLKLENDFTYNRNYDNISGIRNQVEKYERLVKEQAEKIEQARFNEEEAERLKNEAEKLKRKN